MVSIDSCEAAVMGLSHPMLATARISKSSGAKICNFWILRILGSSRFTVSDHPMTLVLPVMAILCGTLVRLWRLTKSRHWTGCDWEMTGGIGATCGKHRKNRNNNNSNNRWYYIVMTQIPIKIMKKRTRVADGLWYNHIWVFPLTSFLSSTGIHLFYPGSDLSSNLISLPLGDLQVKNDKNEYLKPDKVRTKLFTSFY